MQTILKSAFLRLCVSIFSLALVEPLLFAQPISSQASSTQIVLENFIGDVQIIKSGETQMRPATKGEALHPNDKIQTAKDGSAKVLIEGAGELDLGANTIWSYQEYSVDDKEIRFSAHLALGRLKARVKTLPPDSVFEIKTPTSIAAVRGTWFGLFVYLFEGHLFTQLEVLEDLVSFSNLAGTQSFVVGEGQTSTGNDAGEMTSPEASEGEAVDQVLDSEESQQSEDETDLESPNPIQEGQPGQTGFEQEP